MQRRCLSRYHSLPAREGDRIETTASAHFARFADAALRGIGSKALPLPPLDGGRIAVSLLPHRQAYQLAKIEPYGMFILIFLALTSVLWWVLSPLMNVMYDVIRLIFGL